MGEATEMLDGIRAGFRREEAFGAELDAGEVIDGFVTILEPQITDDFFCVMDGGAMTTRYEGIEGLRAGWADFLGAFETISIEPEETYESPDGSCVVEFVGLVGRPKGIDATVEEEAGAVWRQRDGRLSSVEYHMDRVRALRSGGIEPDA